MNNPVNPHDVYSALRSIPFDVAAYCRGHKFSVEAVALSKAVSAVLRAEQQLEVAETACFVAKEEYQRAIADCRIKMERTNGI